MARPKVTFTYSRELKRLFSQDGALAAEAARYALRRVAKWWFKKVLPGHFKFGAYNKYPEAYIRRSKGYEIQKAKDVGHRKPMVLSGAMRSAVLGGRPAIMPNTAQRSASVTVRLPHARAMNLWTGRQHPGHDFAESLTAVSRAEERTISRMVEDDMAKYIQHKIDNGGVVTQRLAG